MGTELSGVGIFPTPPKETADLLGWISACGGWARGMMGGMQGTAESDRVLLDAAAVCGHLLGAGSVHALLAEHRSRLFPDELFGDLFGSGRGRPSVPGEVVAAVMVLQALEGVSDREACRRLQTDVAWKAAAGLALTEGAFHHTVLTLWRNRLRASDRPDRIFDAVRELIGLVGAVSGRDRRVLDSTVLDDAVARQDTVTMLAVQMRRVLKAVPALGEVPVRSRNLDTAGPVVDWSDPVDVERLVTELVDDALDLIGAAEDLDLDGGQSDAVGLLALVAGQDVEPADGPGRWRIAHGTAKGRVLSVVDPESRHAHKTAHSYRDGFKAHIAAEPETGLITAAEITSGAASDADAATGLLDGEPAGTVVLADSAYGTGQLRADLGEAEMTAVIKPPPLRVAVEGGYSIDDFDIDYTVDPHSGEFAGTATCPEGITVNITPKGTARFGANCRRCPQRARCTTAEAGRTLKLHPHHGLLAAARAQARTQSFADDYRRWRPMAERSIAWLTRRNRRCPYIGTQKNRHWLRLRAAAVNLQRLTSLGLHHNGTHWATT